MLTLPFPVAKKFIDDVDDALVLKEVVVAVMAEEGEPGFDDQPVAPKAAVGTLPRDLRNVAVKGAQHRAQGKGLQIQPGRLAISGNAWETPFSPRHWLVLQARNSSCVFRHRDPAILYES